MIRRFLALTLALAAAGTAAGRELTSSYVITAVANTPGLDGTDWHSDVTIYNPHAFELPIVMQLLPSNRNNTGAVPTVELSVLPYETLNLWDILGPDGFAARGSTGALLVYADDQRITCPSLESLCDFVVFARTYTLNPRQGGGEFGQAVPGFPANLGMDWTVMGYLPQVSDDGDFRTNVGVASITPGWVKVRTDLQDPDGNIIDRRDHMIPPYGHVQWRLEQGVTGGTVAAYIVEAPDDAIVYPYASTVNWQTGDAVNIESHLTAVGISAQSSTMRAPRQKPGRLPVPSFSPERLRTRAR
ncbi:MAG: hypothetical protein HY825_09105 [Acidobacteria bacterium]|nr:hypothetical protein [Acidobacteriota bacterium]